MDIDISNIPEAVLRSVASHYTAQVDQLRREAYHYSVLRGRDAWLQIKKEGALSKDKVAYWKEQVAWAKVRASQGTS